MISYPNIDPVLLSLGPLDIRWYSLAYVLGIILGAWYILNLNKRFTKLDQLKPFDDMLLWAILGIILGGRIGYILFYQFGYYMHYPTQIFKIWEGGMSFHGGLVGFTLAMFWYAKRQHYPFLSIMDLCAGAAPIGLFLGRIANFINGELFGRVTDASIGMVFPNGGPYPRHPSQLYEAILEGIVLFIVLFAASYSHFFKTRRGALAGLFLCGYSLARIVVEHFREPDPQLGFIVAGITMGQLLSVPMILLGVALIFRSKKYIT